MRTHSNVHSSGGAAADSSGGSGPSGQLRRHSSSLGSSTKIDVYSFGVLMWVLWTGNGSYVYMSW